MTTCPANGYITGVAYVPEPLASAIRRLSASLPSESEPHVTVLPPRPLSSLSGGILNAMREVLKCREVFEIELGTVSRFPETDVVYLSVGEGYEEIQQLHSELAQQGPVFLEPFEFRPHLTLGGPISAEIAGQRMSILQAEWDQFVLGHRFRVEEVEFLWLAPDGNKNDWKRLGIYPLKRKRSNGVAALESNAQSGSI